MKKSLLIFTKSVFTIAVLIITSLHGVGQSQFIYFYPLNNNANNNPFTANVDSYLNTTDATNGMPVGCFNADITAQNNNGTWVVDLGNRSPKWTNSGSTFSLMLYTDWNDASTLSSITFSITFKQGATPVNASGVTFNLYDINAAACGSTSGVFIDSVSVRGRNTANVYQNMTLSSINSCIIATGSGTTTTTFKGGNSCGANALSSTITFTGAISTLEITYRSGKNYPAHVSGSCAGYPIINSTNPRTQYIIISPLNLGACPPLPLENFNLHSKGLSDRILIEWNTSEFNPENTYILERSENGVDFNSLTMLSQERGSFYDRIFTPHSDNLYYYRVLSVSKDGQKFYSSIVQAKLEPKQDLTIKIFPNPAYNLITIENTSHETTNMQILDYTGKKVYEGFLQNLGTITVDVGHFAPGMYFARFDKGKTVVFTKQ